MSTMYAAGPPARQPAAPHEPHDGRGSPIPTRAMIATRFTELRKRRGLMITLTSVTIGIPTVFLAIRLVLHAVDPKTYGPAGGYQIYVALSAGVLYTFGFIVAATLGCSAGSLDLTDGMFRHLVVTGRSRVALYLARIPAGLAIIIPLVAIGFTIVCTVCALAAPTTLNYNGMKVPANLSLSGLESWAGDHVNDVLCNVPTDNALARAARCGDAAPAVKDPSAGPAPSPAELRAAAVQIAAETYPKYRTQFLVPPLSLMIKTGLWLELEAMIGFVVGLGLGSLLGQRTVAVVLMIVLEIILTPIVVRSTDSAHGEPRTLGRRCGDGAARTRSAAARARRWRARLPDHRIGHHCGVRDPRLAGGMDGDRRLADGHPRRVTAARRPRARSDAQIAVELRPPVVERVVALRDHLVTAGR